MQEFHIISYSMECLYVNRSYGFNEESYNKKMIKGSTFYQENEVY